MPRTYTRLLVHMVFSTKGHVPFLAGDVGPALHEYVGGIARKNRTPALVAGGYRDHVHILFSLRPDLSVSDVARVVKANSSKWLRQNNPALKAFAWQAGYSAFSVSESNRDAVEAYIRGQATHHRRMSFREELIALLDRHGVGWDERYLSE